MIHVHVDPTGPKLVEHLLNALLPCCRLFRAADPTEVVVALVARAPLVVVKQTLAGQSLLDVGWHRIGWSGRHSPIKTHSSSMRNAQLTRLGPAHILEHAAEFGCADLARTGPSRRGHRSAVKASCSTA